MIFESESEMHESSPHFALATVARWFAVLAIYLARRMTREPDELEIVALLVSSVAAIGFWGAAVLGSRSPFPARKKLNAAASIAEVR
jgi:hypothetical protein